MTAARPSRQSDSGAALILALVFLLAVGTLIVAVGQFAVTAQSNTINLKAERALRANASSAATVAIQQVRVNYAYQPDTSQTALHYDGTPYLCAPGWVNTSYKVTVFCQGTAYPGTASSRVVDFYVCKNGTSASTCTAAGSSSTVLVSEVIYDDVPAGQPTGAQCSAGSSGTCGLTVSISKWDIRLADS